ncbi:putative protein StfE, partial [Escherichia coli EC1850]
MPVTRYFCIFIN